MAEQTLKITEQQAEEMKAKIIALIEKRYVEAEHMEKTAEMSLRNQNISKLIEKSFSQIKNT